MGNSNKKPQDYDVVRSFKREDWINVESRGGYQIWENIVKNIRADVYPLPSQLTNSDLGCYQMRHNNNPDIVQVYNLELDKELNICANSSNSQVFVERIPYRLSQVNDLSIDEALTVLRSTYSGFNTLSTLFGPVEPYQDLVCFNEEGKTKIWVNCNLAENKIQKERQPNPMKNLPTYNEAYVNKILLMVERKIKDRESFELLKTKFRQLHPQTYFQALNIIEEFATEQRIIIARTIQPRNCQRNPIADQHQTIQMKDQNYSYGKSIQGLPLHSHQVPPIKPVNIYQMPYDTRQHRIISAREPLKPTSVPTSGRTFYTFAPKYNQLPESQPVFQPTSSPLIPTSNFNKGQINHQFTENINTINPINHINPINPMNPINPINPINQGGNKNFSNQAAYRYGLGGKPYYTFNNSSAKSINSSSPIPPQNDVTPINTLLPSKMTFESPDKVAYQQVIRGTRQIVTPFSVPVQSSNQQLTSQQSGGPKSQASVGSVRTSQLQNPNMIKPIEPRIVGMFSPQQNILQPAQPHLQNIRNIQEIPQPQKISNPQPQKPTSIQFQVPIPQQPIQPQINTQSIALSKPMSQPARPTLRSQTIQAQAVQQLQQVSNQNNNNIKFQQGTIPIVVAPVSPSPANVTIKYNPKFVQNQNNIYYCQPGSKPTVNFQFQQLGGSARLQTQMGVTQIIQPVQIQQQQQQKTEIISQQQPQQQSQKSQQQQNNFHFNEVISNQDNQHFFQRQQLESNQDEVQILQSAKFPPQQPQQHFNPPPQPPLYQQSKFQSEQQNKVIQFQRHLNNVRELEVSTNMNEVVTFNQLQEQKDNQYQYKQMKNVQENETNLNKIPIYINNNDDISIGQQNKQQQQQNKKPQQNNNNDNNIKYQFNLQFKTSQKDEPGRKVKTEQATKTQTTDKPTDVFSNTTGLPYMSKNKQKYSQQYSNDQKIPDNAKYQDIEQYIRNKFNLDNGNNNENNQKQKQSNTASRNYQKRQEGADINQIGDYVQNKYNQYSKQNNTSNNDNQQFSFRPTVPLPQKRSDAGRINDNYGTVRRDNKYKQESPIGEIKSGRIRSNNNVSSKKQIRNYERETGDVVYPEKSRQKKNYQYAPPQSQIKNLRLERKPDSDNQYRFDVRKLQDTLIQFQQNKIRRRPTNKQQPTNYNFTQSQYQFSTVSKTNNNDERERRSSIRKNVRNNVPENENSKNYGKGYENNSPYYQYDQKSSVRSSRMSKDLYNIDEKFNKYVKNINKSGSSGYIKPVFKQQSEHLINEQDRGTPHMRNFEQINRYQQVRQYDTVKNSRVRQGNYEQKKPFSSSQVTMTKNLTYHDLRQFLWS